MATLASHIACERCKYDLHGQDILSACPECGLAVATTLAGHSDVTLRSLVALQRPVRIAVVLIAIPLTCMLAAVFQSAGPMIAFIDWISNRSSEFAQNIRLVGWAASCVLLMVSLVITLFALLPSEFSLRAEMRKWRPWLYGGLVLWIITLLALCIIFVMKPFENFAIRDAVSMCAPALQLPAFSITLMSYRRLLSICGRRSQAFREAGSAQQKINLLIYALALVAVGAIASPVLLNRLGWQLAAVASDGLVVVETGILIFGLAYLVANAFWISQSLLLPPMKFDR